MLPSLLLPKFPTSMRLYLVKALLPLCALMLLVLPMPSWAGHWEITYNNNGTCTMSNLGIPPFDTPHTFSWLTSSPYSYTDEGWFNESTTGSVTAVLTWLPDGDALNDDPLNDDPLPKHVLIAETSSAVDCPSSWAGPGPAPLPTGSVSDGLGDPPVAVSDGGYAHGGYKSAGTHLIQKDGSSGCIKLDPVTLSAANPTTSWLSGGPDWLWEGTVDVAFRVSVVADEPIPVNFHQDNVSNIGDGNLSFHYSWDSSTGNQPDLVNWTICETVTYKNNSAGFFQNDQDGVYCYFPPDPFDGRHQEPTQLDVPATDYGSDDTQGNLGFSTPYKEASYTGIQKFAALNKITGEQIDLLGPFTTTRSVDNTICTPEGDYYEYAITKNGSKATLDLGTGR